MAIVDGWETPPGTHLIRHTPHPTICCKCRRPEPAGSTVLAYHNGNVRCVDTGDCQDIINLGRWPAAQRPLHSLAHALDHGYQITR